jgi:hypothetical protein
MVVSCHVHVPAASAPQKEGTSTHLGSQEGPRGGTDVFKKKEIFYSCQEANNYLAIQPTAESLYKVIMDSAFVENNLKQLCIMSA